MRRVLHLLAALSLAVGAVGSTALAADEELIANPPFAHWSAFKVGTTVTQREQVRFTHGSDEAAFYPGGVHEKTLTYRLLEVTPQKAVVEMKVVEYGPGELIEPAPSRITYPAKVKRSHASTSKAAFETFKEGDEDLKVLGKSVRCHWVEIIDKEGDEVFYHKVWSTDAVPGGIVKDIKTQKKGATLVSESDHVIESYRMP